MKKIFSLAIISLSLLSGITQAADYKISNSAFNCTALSFSGRGGNFISVDNALEAKLFFELRSGDTVSGGIGALIDGKRYVATLVESHCRLGNLTLRWNQPNFKGSIQGRIDIENNAIINISGNINGHSVTSSILLFTGYGDA